MRRRTPTGDPGERPKLTLIDGGLSAEDVERQAARRHHPTATHRDGGFDGPEAV
jgi:hypothetical protein